MVSKITIGLATVFIATFMLFYIFYNLDLVAKGCKAGTSNPETCKKMGSFTLPTLIALLIISGFIIVILTTSYILISPGQPK